MPDVLVDTSVWSLALRRKTSNQQEVIVNEFAELIRETRVRIIGPIWQEMWSFSQRKDNFLFSIAQLRRYKLIRF